MKKIFILGLPNTGKSQIFSNLTKEFTIVANFPFTTVEIKKARAQIGLEEYEVVDTPGLHCLYIHSEEELYIRNMLLSEKPDIIIQCVDANRLKQSLTLTADLLELDIPMVVSLNAVDETTKKGIWLDSTELSNSLKVPVVETVAINGVGTEDLKRAILQATKGRHGIKLGNIIEDGLSKIRDIFPENIEFKDKISRLALIDDPFLEDYVKEKCGKDVAGALAMQIKAIKKKYKGNIAWLVNEKRNKWIVDIIERVVKHQKIQMPSFTHAFAHYSRHPIYGIPILMTVLFLMFFSVVNVANEVATWMHTMFWVPIEAKINILIPSGFWNEFLIGDYGFLTFGLSNAILTVLPILSVFFLLFNTLEDIGYIPNLCVLLKRISEKIGLSASAIMPITLGFGCKTMATLTTKSLRSEKERYIAIYLIAFALPCAAQMALNMSILGRMGIRAFLIAFGVLVFVEILAGIVLNAILKDEIKSDFIQSLPDIRLPSIKAVLKKTYYKLYWFLKEALPIFISAAVFLFFADKIGVLDALKNILKPIIIGFLGFPLEMVDVLILCMAKHEAAAAMLIKLIQKGHINYIQCIVAVTLTTMFVPCLANVVAMIKELGFKKGIVMVVIINLTAILIGGMLNWSLVLTIGH